MTSSLAYRDALRVLQQVVVGLASWVDLSPPIDPFSQPLAASSVVEEYLGWGSNRQLFKTQNWGQPLQVIFDSIQLQTKQSNLDRNQQNWPACFFEDNVQFPKIPYPSQDTVNIDDLKAPIRAAIASLSEPDWQNFSLLLLLIEKFGAYLSVGEQADVSLLDWTRTTAAVAAALANQPEAKNLALVSGDLSGIQNFIYPIPSDGALKSLRARSFYLELVTQEVVEQLLETLDVPRTNVIYAGGGNLYLLVAGDDEAGLDLTIKTVQKKFNSWLRQKFQGKVFLALDYNRFPVSAIASSDFSQVWEASSKKLAPQKLRKFKHEIGEMLQVRDAYTPCQVCHRDDTPDLKPLNDNEADSSLACDTCRSMFELGARLFKVEAIARTNIDTPKIPGALYRLNCGDSYYHLFDTPKQAQAISNSSYFIINNWTLANYKTANTSLMLLGNYGHRIKDDEEEGRDGFIHSREMAKRAEGIQRFACLRMDVDRLGQIFAKGLGDKQTLTRLGGLSRQMSYFFKVYLNSLAAARIENLPHTARSLTSKSRENLLFIYAGGDDLFVTGPWNEIVEFSFDIYQAFRAYTGYNQDITLSGGISLHDPKYPLYLAAQQSGEAEEAAKGNGRDSLGLFGEVFKWDEWLGISQHRLIESEFQTYLQDEARPELFGIFPLVQQLQRPDINYTRSFVRNLLNTANLQAQILREFADSRRKPHYANEPKDTRYYLHLPRIAYTLSRLPDNVRTADSFKPVRTSLKNPRTAPYFKAIATWLELLNRKP
jgi:CRISPR-associated protein Csm1